MYSDKSIKEYFFFAFQIYKLKNKALKIKSNRKLNLDIKRVDEQSGYDVILAVFQGFYDVEAGGAVDVELAQLIVVVNCHAELGCCIVVQSSHIDIYKISYN